MAEPTQALRIRGASWLDTSTGETSPTDLLIDGGLIQDDDGRAAREVDAAGTVAMFGLWDCHSHAGGMMYDPVAAGYFESVADRTIRAGENFIQAASMGVTGVRCVDDADELDLSWSRAFAAGTTLGPRVHGAGRGIRTTGGHGTSYPRTHTQLEAEHIVDGPTEMARAVRTQVERGAHWIKIMLTGGLASPHEAADACQFTEAELATLMEVADLRGIPVAAHCGGTQTAITFSNLGGRSVEHGYMLQPEAARVMADNGTWLVPTIGVTHDQDYITEQGWPDHAANRARELIEPHAAALHACIDAGVKIAIGADLNPIGPRYHRELELLEEAGMSRQAVLHAASVGGRELNGFGESSTPDPGAAADVILLTTNPVDSLDALRSPALVVTHGRPVVDRMQN